MGSLDTQRKERSRFRKLEESHNTELNLQPREVNESVDAIDKTYSALPYDDESGDLSSIQPTSKDISYGDKIESNIVTNPPNTFSTAWHMPKTLQKLRKDIEDPYISNLIRTSKNYKFDKIV